MKNFLGKLRNVDPKKKAFYFSAFMLICFFVALPIADAHAYLGENLVYDAITKAVMPVIFEVLKLVLSFAALLVYLGAWLVDVMLNPAMYRAVLVGTVDPTTGVSTGAVQVGWRTVRDCCNMFYVFFLLFIAFATIVGNQSYGYKNLLPKFVISLFLINFSAEITKMVIDVGQVFLFGMAGSWLGSFSGASGGGMASIVQSFKAQFNGLTAQPDAITITSLLFAVVYTFILGIIYVMLAMFLLLRLVMFAVLIIISPFAFFSMVLPSMGKYTTQWWGQLISNTISGPVFIFFVYLSAVMAKELTDNPIGTDPATLGDISQLGNPTAKTNIASFLMMIIPNVVAIGILLFSVTAAKSVGAAGASSIAGGRFGIGKVAGMGYAGFKLGERATRRAGGGAVRGLGYAKDAGVRNSTKLAGLENWAHEKYQSKLGSIGERRGLGGITTSLSQRDAGAVERAKKNAIDQRQKKYGDNLKALDWKRLTQGDNVDKAVALRAAAEQHDLGKPELAKHFTAASSVMSQGEIKDMTNQNLSFNTLTSENRNKRKMDAFKNEDGTKDEAAQGRIAVSIKDGMSEADASKQEIMRGAAIKAINKGDDTKVQGLENEADAVAMVEGYKETGQLTKLGDKPLMHRKKLREGVTAHVKEVEMKRQSTSDETKKTALEADKMVYAGAAIKTGATVDAALAADQTQKRGGNTITTEGNKDYERHANQLFAESVDSSDIIGMKKEDRTKHGFRATETAITGVGKKRDSEKLQDIKDSLATAKTDQLAKNPDPTHADYKALVDKEKAANKELG